MTYRRFAVFLALVALVACGGSGDVTGPAVQDSAVSTEPEQAAAVDAPAPAPAPAVAPTPDPEQNGQRATVHANGTVEMFNGHLDPWDKQICYFWNGPHPQETAHPAKAVSVAPGRTENFPMPNLRSKAPRCGKREVQIDVGGSCAQSAHIPGMVAAGYVWVKGLGEMVTEESTVYSYTIRNREGRRTDYYFDDMAVSLAPGESYTVTSGSLGLTVTWVDAGRRTRTYTFDRCHSGVSNRCHSEFSCSSKTTTEEVCR